MRSWLVDGPPTSFWPAARRWSPSLVHHIADSCGSLDMKGLDGIGQKPRGSFHRGTFLAKGCKFLLVLLGKALRSGSGGWWGLVCLWEVREREGNGEARVCSSDTLTGVSDFSYFSYSRWLYTSRRHSFHQLLKLSQAFLIDLVFLIVFVEVGQIGRRVQQKGSVGKPNFVWDCLGHHICRLDSAEAGERWILHSRWLICHELTILALYFYARSPPVRNIGWNMGGPSLVRFGYSSRMEQFQQFPFSVPMVPLGKGTFSVCFSRFRFRFRFLKNGSDGSGSDFGSWKTVPTVLVCGSGSAAKCGGISAIFLQIFVLQPGKNGRNKFRINSSTRQDFIFLRAWPKILSLRYSGSWGAQCISLEKSEQNDSLQNSLRYPTSSVPKTQQISRTLAHWGSGGHAGTRAQTYLIRLRLSQSENAATINFSLLGRKLSGMIRANRFAQLFARIGNSSDSVESAWRAIEIGVSIANRFARIARATKGRKSGWKLGEILDEIFWAFSCFICCTEWPSKTPPNLPLHAL